MATTISTTWMGPKQKRAAQIPQALWDSFKDEIFKLHAEMKVDDLIHEMKKRHGFIASKHQFVLQLKKWDRRKYRTASRGIQDTPTDSDTSTPAYVDGYLGGAGDASPLMLLEFSIDEDLDLGGKAPLQTPICQRQLYSERRNSPDSFRGNLDMQCRTPPSTTLTKNHSTESFGIKGARNDEEGQASMVAHEGGSPRASDLRRVPRTKRMRSTSSIDRTPSNRKRQRGENSLLQKADDPNDWDKLLNTVHTERVYSPSANDYEDIAWPRLDQSNDSTSIESAYENWNPPTDTPSLNGIAEDSEEIGRGNHQQPSPLTRLLKFAEQGDSSKMLSYNHIREIEHLAGFFFGAALYEEAFLLYMLVYRSLKVIGHPSKDVLLAILFNIARSSTTGAQDEIVRSLLQKALRKRHHQSNGEPHENFLINAFLTIIYRRQKELSKADHHCHRAINCFDQHPTTSRSKVMNSWRSLAVVACTKLDYNITQKRLISTQSEISTDVRLKVCSRASDQLIQLLQSYWASETIAVDACLVVGQDVLFNSYDGPFIAQPRALRSLFEWCLQALENTSTQFDNRQPWREFRAKGMKLRAIGISTLYCQLWRHWRLECGDMPLVNTTSDYWSVGIQEQLGIPPMECLAAIPESIAVAWPFDDESMPLLANWRTYQAELCRRAIRGLKALLEQPDVGLAHYFLQAYSARCIAEPKPDDASQSDPCRSLHRECMMAFVTDCIDLDFLDLESPIVDSPVQMHSAGRFLGEAWIAGNSEIGATTLHATPLSSVRESDVPEGQPVVTQTGMPGSVVQIHDSGVRGLIPAQTPTARSSIRDAALFTQRVDSKSSYRSATTVSTDFASMLSLRLRTNHCQVRSFERTALEPPSSAMRNGFDIDTSLDSILGLARNSLESLCLHESVHECEMTDNGSMTKLLSTSSSQIDVTVI